LITLPLLVVLADATGVTGGALIASWELGLAPGFYFSHAFRMLTWADYFSGIAKTVVFAFAVGIVSCHNGLETRGGADGVGTATTETVVAVAISVLVLDFFLTKLLMAL
jgi:phospholipid/cholesterol/gamma-HCH transport system permease protein